MPGQQHGNGSANSGQNNSQPKKAASTDLIPTPLDLRSRAETSFMRGRPPPDIESNFEQVLQDAHEHHKIPGQHTASRAKSGPATPSSPLPRLYTVAEAAKILRLSIRSVRRMIGQQKLAAIHIGRAVRIREEALRKLIDG